MNTILKMQNSIQPYVWGSRKALAQLLGRPQPSDSPQAELWMGAHPKAPSKVYLADQWQDLDEAIRKYPEAILGDGVCRRYNNQLPYLFKVLAADQPLSIQAHPSKQQAERGFERENAQAIPLSAGNRNYKDANHKPECICALTPFWGVCGFRPFQEMMPLLSPIWPADFQAELKRLDRADHTAGDRDFRSFFEFLMNLSPMDRKRLIQSIVAAAGPLAEQEAAFEWVLRLNRQYPDDIGILSPVLLNLFCLQPEQALFLPAGQLHAYFGGMGIEIMANSDNVLRGGLTPKHVDLFELLKILDFNPRPLTILNAARVGTSEYRYPSEVGEFVLSRLQVSDAHPYSDRPSAFKSPQILLCTHGSALIRWNKDRSEICLPQGQSVLVPAALPSYNISGEATLYRAAVNPEVATPGSEEYRY
jgi:mannose-6-phosphate isomerase